MNKENLNVVYALDESETRDLVVQLRDSTPLGKLSEADAKAIFDRLPELNFYVVSENVVRLETL